MGDVVIASRLIRDALDPGHLVLEVLPQESSHPRRVQLIWLGSAFTCNGESDVTVASNAPHSELVVGRNDHAPRPLLYRLSREELADATTQCVLTRLAQPYEQHTGMTARSEQANVREVEILGDEEPALDLRGLPDVRVHEAHESFILDGVDVVTKRTEV